MQHDRIDQIGIVLLTLRNGVQVSIDCSWNRPAQYPRWGNLIVDVIGDAGSLRADAVNNTLTLTASMCHSTPLPLKHADRDHVMLASFIQTIQNGSAPPVTWDDAYHALRVTLAAYQAHTENQPVQLSS